MCGRNLDTRDLRAQPWEAAAQLRPTGLRGLADYAMANPRRSRPSREPALLAIRAGLVSSGCGRRYARFRGRPWPGKQRASARGVSPSALRVLRAHRAQHAGCERCARYVRCTRSPHVIAACLGAAQGRSINIRHRIARPQQHQSRFHLEGRAKTVSNMSALELYRLERDTGRTVLRPRTTAQPSWQSRTRLRPKVSRTGCTAVGPRRCACARMRTNARVRAHQLWRVGDGEAGAAAAGARGCAGRTRPAASSWFGQRRVQGTVICASGSLPAVQSCRSDSCAPRNSP